MNESDIKTVRCAIYARKSTAHGMEQDYTSIDAQVDSCLSYITNHLSEGWQLATTSTGGIYRDVAISGATLDRPGMQALLAEVRAGKVDAVICYKLDRISRSIQDFSNLVYEFEELGVSLVLVTQNFDSSSPMGRLCLHFLSSFSEFERSMIRDRIRDKAAARAEQGLWVGGRPPFGYYLGEQRALLQEPEQAATVKRIYALILSGSDMSQIADILNRENAPRPAPRGKADEASPWTATRIKEVISRPLYRGAIIYHGKEFRGKHEPLVSTKDWDKAQQYLRALLDGRKPRIARKGDLVYPLKGIIKCSLCGRTLAATYSSSHGRINRYYVCPNHYGSSKSCPARNLPAGSMEMAVASNLASYANDPNMIRALQERLPQLARRDIPEALANVEQLVEHIPDAALATLFSALYKSVSYNEDTQELTIEKYSS